jgi:hypothetical protein
MPSSRIIFYDEFCQQSPIPNLQKAKAWQSDATPKAPMEYPHVFDTLHTLYSTENNQLS